MRMRLIHSIAIVLATLAACGGDGGSGGTGPSTAALEGTYVGTATITNEAAPGQPFTLSFTVVGNGSGNILSGVWVIGVNAGTIAGAISGSSATFTLTETSPCTGTFTGTATLSNDGNHVEGTFSGTDCDGNQTGTFVLDRSTGGTALTGDYVGTANVAGAGTLDVQITIVQTGNILSGTWSNEMGGSGTATGTVNGSTVDFTLTQTDPCPGSYSGTGLIQNGGSRITGSYNGTDCGFDLSATFTVNRR